MTTTALDLIKAAQSPRRSISALELLGFGRAAEARGEAAPDVVDAGGRVTTSGDPGAPPFPRGDQYEAVAEQIKKIHAAGGDRLVPMSGQMVKAAETASGQELPLGKSEAYGVLASGFNMKESLAKSGTAIADLRKRLGEIQERRARLAA